MPRAWLRYDVVERVLAGLRPRTVLELGCGQGSMGARLARRAEYVGVEPDPTSFALARTRVGAAGGAVVQGDHTAVPAGSSYDLVCAFEVLEHMRDDAAVLAEWTRFVRPGGHLMLSVPAFQRRFGPMDERVGHYRRYGPEELAARLVERRAERPRVTVYGWPLGYLLEAVRNRADRPKLAAGRPVVPAGTDGGERPHVPGARAGGRPGGPGRHPPVPLPAAGPAPPRRRPGRGGHPPGRVAEHPDHLVRCPRASARSGPPAAPSPR